MYCYSVTLCYCNDMFYRNDDPKTFQFNTVSHYEEMQHPFATCHENTNTNVVSITYQYTVTLNVQYVS